MARKTIDVKTLVAQLSEQMLRTEIRDCQGTLCGVISNVLMDTGNYKGFGWCDRTGKMIPTEEAQSMNPDSEGYYMRKYY